jgi:hypothetical protein
MHLDSCRPPPPPSLCSTPRGTTRSPQAKPKKQKLAVVSCACMPHAALTRDCTRAAAGCFHVGLCLGRRLQPKRPLICARHLPGLPEPSVLLCRHDLILSLSHNLVQCAPVRTLSRSCASKAGPTALMDQLCRELLAPANATTDSKVRAHTHNSHHMRMQSRVLGQINV